MQRIATDDQRCPEAKASRRDAVGRRAMTVMQLGPKAL